MAITATTRPLLSSVLGVDDENNWYIESYAKVNVRTTSGSLVKSPFGIPVIWDNALTAFRPLANADTIPTTTSTLPNGAPVAVVVGDATGVGNDRGDITLTTTSQPLTVVFRDHSVFKEGVTYETAVLTATRDLFQLQLEKQDVVVRSKSPVITQSFTA